MQRLFSTFANGWPGKGLLVLRVALAVYILHDFLAKSGESPGAPQQILRIITAASGLLILAGLWTPVACILAALTQVWTAVSQSGDPWAAALAAALGLGLALLGPGAYSVDSLAYGRKRISFNHPIE